MTHLPFIYLSMNFNLPFAQLSKRYSLFLLTLLSLGSWQATQACVDPDTIAQTIINYDSAFRQVEIRVTNLRLMTESPNTFCSCAVSSYSDIFTDLLYVAFVDSGTNDVYSNFAEWDASAPASASWDASATNYPSWNGFVAEVVNNGLSPAVPVDLLIRAALPPGYNLVILDSSMFSTFVGTDEWDPAMQTLTNSHQGLHGLGNQGTIFQEKDSSYFAELDLEIEEYFTSSISPTLLLPALTWGPNPTVDLLTLSYESQLDQIINLDIVDVQGRIFIPVFKKDMQGIKHEIQIDLDQMNLPHGLYILRLRGRESQMGLKFLKQ